MAPRCCDTTWIVGGCLLALVAAPLAAADWREFRGPAGQGRAESTAAPLAWSETENVVWKTALPGRGWSSPVVGDGLIWMTTALETPYSDDSVASERGGRRGGQPGTAVARIELLALGVDAQTGGLVHQVPLFVVDDPQPVHALNSFASPTPVLDGGRLYCNFGTFGTACVDVTAGRVAWSNQDVQIDHETGPGSSPVLCDDRLILNCDGIDQQYIIAWDAQTGEIAWRVERSGEIPDSPSQRKSFATCQIVEVDGRDVLLSPATNWLYAYEPATGEELWKVSYETLGYSVVSRPVTAGGVAYFSTAFNQANVLAVRFAENGAATAPEILWRYTKQAPNMPSLLVDGEELYFVSDRGVATCVDAETGEVHWAERLEGEFSASPLAIGGRIYFFGRTTTTVVAPGTEFRVLAENQLDGEVMATPACLEDAVILRTSQAIYRLEPRGQ